MRILIATLFLMISEMAMAGGEKRERRIGPQRKPRNLSSGSGRGCVEFHWIPESLEGMFSSIVEVQAGARDQILYGS
jgi:hypothetical protein